MVCCGVEYDNDAQSGAHKHAHRSFGEIHQTGSRRYKYRVIVRHPSGQQDRVAHRADEDRQVDRINDTIETRLQRVKKTSEQKSRRPKEIRRQRQARLHGSRQALCECCICGASQCCGHSAIATVTKPAILVLLGGKTVRPVHHNGGRTSRWLACCGLANRLPLGRLSNDACRRR